MICYNLEYNYNERAIVLMLSNLKTILWKTPKICCVLEESARQHNHFRLDRRFATSLKKFGLKIDSEREDFIKIYGEDLYNMIKSMDFKGSHPQGFYYIGSFEEFKSIIDKHYGGEIIPTQQKLA